MSSRGLLYVGLANLALGCTLIALHALGWSEW